MTRNSAEVPEFLRDALDASEAAPDLADAVAGLSSLLPLAVPLGRERLLGAVRELPLRYAPFYERMATLWDLPVSDVETLLIRARDPSAWRKPGLPGLKVVDVEGGPRVQGARVTLVRFAAGMRFPSHAHPGPEALFVLEGSYRDVSGRLVGPGDLHEMAPGSSHWFRVGKHEACVAASVQFGFEFTGTWMRLLARVFG